MSRNRVRSWIAAVLLGLASNTPLDAQPPPPQPVIEEKRPEPAPKGEEAKKFERDGSAQVVHYMLGGIGVIMVMILICMPLRRD